MKEGNLLINIMLRRVGRIWECRATCSLHDTSGIAADIDDKEKVLLEALEKLPCDCYKRAKTELGKLYPWHKDWGGTARGL